MLLVNTAEHYGAVAKALHWAVAALILTVLPLGLIANAWPYETQAQLETKALVFSIHKTVGLAAFFAAILRILWALFQPKPLLLNADRRVESLAAETVHWLLYASLIIVPLSGWLHHAASTGFAPIWWPFGQSLPFVPKDPDVAHFFAAWHYVFTKVLAVALVLHIAGALKHHFADRDVTLLRMLPGRIDIAGLEPASRNVHRGARSLAIVVYGLAIMGASVLGLQADRTTAATLEQVDSDWAVEQGTLDIAVVQMGDIVTGRFDDWTAAIAFQESPIGGRHGDVDVTIAVGSLSLGSVTSQALGDDFLNIAGFETARFVADIVAGDPDGGYLADGALTIRGISVPVELPFRLEIVDGLANMVGEITLDRRDFEMGQEYPDESSVGFSVVVTVTLTARRAGDGDRPAS